MARRSKNSGEVSAFKGRFYRNLGKVLNSDGKVVPKNFLLGTDQLDAEIANRLLEKLWTCVVREHEGAERLVRQMGGRLGDVNHITGIIDFKKLRRVDHGPIWRDESLLIAEAI